MIKKAQIRFFCITMALLFAVFASILCVAYYVCSASCQLSIRGRLDRLTLYYKIYTDEDDKALLTHEGVIVVKQNHSSSFIILDAAGMPNEQIYQIVSAAFNTYEQYPQVTSSYFDKIYYRIIPMKAETLLVAADMCDYYEKATKSVLIILFTLLILYLILALVVWGLSFKVFHPIKEMLYKHKKFISDASHELKTPIAVISANADVLASKTDNDKFVKSIKSQAKRMSLLVTDMLTLAKMDETTFTPLKESFNLSDAVTESVLPFDAVAFENGKTLLSEIESGIDYVGDRESVKKVVNILLDNAVKYSSVGGTIKVTLAKNVLTISNTGSDIKDIDSDKIFERFFRGDASRSRDTGGSGLGLSIAKSIANANKWDIKAVSKFGESMTITICF